MPSLLDIAPATKTVPIDGHDIEVKGISARQVANLLQKFPELRVMVTGGEITWDTLLTIAPAAAEIIMAYGTGLFGDAEGEEKIASLPLETQVDLLEAIGAVTFKKGFAPFMERVKGMAPPAPATAPAPALAVNTTKAAATKSAQQSKLSFPEEATQKKVSGIKPPAN